MEHEMTGQTARAMRPTLSVAGLLHRKAERTPERVKACLLFDDLCERAFTKPNERQHLERIPSTHDGFSRGGDQRIAAMDEVRRLTARIGTEPFAILFARIHQRDEFGQMERDGLGMARVLSLQFIHAVDDVAHFYGLAGPSRVVQCMEDRLSTIRDA